MRYIFLLIITTLTLLHLPSAFAQIDAPPENMIDYSAPKSYEIGGISVTGTKYLDENVLVTLSGLTVGDNITIPGDNIPNAIKSLWKQGLFADVQIYATKIINDVIFLEFKLEERARLSRYTFEGVRTGEEEDLREAISLVRGRIITENLLNTTEIAVLNFYRKKGFLNATVDLIQMPDPNFKNSNVLTVKLNRMEKVRINEIVINGNSEILARKLKKQMDGTKEKAKIYLDAPKRLWRDLKKGNIGDAFGNLSLVEAYQYIDENIVRLNIFSNSKFIEDDFEADKAAVIDYYNNKGYRDARIISDTIHHLSDRSIDVVLNVEEGNKYYFRDIIWRGNSKYDDETLTRILNIKKGDVYSKSRLDARLYMDINSSADVSSLYMDDGYLFFQVTPVEKAVEGDSIDLVINVYEGAQATIDRVIIKGNDKTNEHVIRRELRTMPGSKFSRSDIIRSQREIAGLGMFDPELTNIVPIPKPESGTVDLEYTVVEKSSDQLELSAGWGFGTVVGSVGVTLNNFSARNIFKKDGWKPVPSGDGQRLSFRFQSTGPAFQSLNASFTEPWLGGKKPNSLTLSAFSSRSCRNCRFTNVAEEDKEILYITGGSVGLGQRLRWPDDNFTLQNSINFQNYQLQNWRSDFIFGNGTSNTLSFTSTLARYSINNPIFPSSGSNISLSVQFTPPFSLISGQDFSDLPVYDPRKYKWAEYHKWKFKAEWFVSLANKLVLRTAVKAGLMGFYNNDIGHSPFERFQVGGDGISNFNLYGKDIIALRGYEETDVTYNPQTIEELDSDGNIVYGIDGKPQTRTVNVGDPFYAKYTLELRYLLTKPENQTTTFYALAFVEGGDSWSTFKEFNPFEIKRTAGLGLRVYLPMFGTLGFDYGVGFDKPGVYGNTWDYISNKGRFSVVLGFEPE